MILVTTPMWEYVLIIIADCANHNNNSCFFVKNILHRNQEPRSLPELVEYYDNSDLRRAALGEIERPDFIPSNFNPPEFNGNVIISICNVNVVIDIYASGFGTQLVQNVKRSIISMMFRRKTGNLFPHTILFMLIYIV